MRDRSWHYRRAGHNLGPVSFAELTHLVVTGALAPTDLVRPYSNDEWVPVSAVPELAVALASSSAPRHAETAPPNVASDRMPSQELSPPGLTSDHGARDP